MSTDYAALNRALVSSLGDVAPVAVSYLDSAPAGLPKFAGTMPSGCSFWSLAAGGDGFYTVPSDHLNCPIGSYTHAIDLPADRAKELERTLSLMAGIGYMRMEEVPSIPRLREDAVVHRLCTAGQGSDDAGRGHRRRASRAADAASGSGGQRRRGIIAAAARPADVHGAAGGDGARRGDELGLHRQPRLHRPWRRPAVPDDSRQSAR